jgi:predicted hydrocarbon binding protein
MTHPALALLCDRCGNHFRTPTLRLLCDPCRVAAIRFNNRPKVLGREVAHRAREFGREFGQALADAMTEEATV